MTDEQLVEWYECRRKDRYETFADADAVAMMVSVQVGKDLGAYQCVWCDGFHYGKQRSSVAPRGWPARLAKARYAWRIRGGDEASTPDTPPPN